MGSFYRAISNEGRRRGRIYFLRISKFWMGEKNFVEQDRKEKSTGAEARCSGGKTKGDGFKQEYSGG